MSATMTAPAPAGHAKAGYVGATRSEVIKYQGLRSTWILTAVTAVLLVGIGILSAWGISYAASNDDSLDPTTAELASVASNGFLFGQLLLISLGVIFVSGEWASGACRTSLLAVDRRRQFFAAKATVLAVVAAAVTAVSGLINLVVAIPFFSDLPFEPFGGDAMYILATLSLVAALIALMGLGLGLLIRNSAGGIVVGIALLIVLPIVLAIISNWSRTVGDIAEYLPMNAASVFTNPEPGPESIGHGMALVTILAWTAALVVPGAARLVATDV